MSNLTERQSREIAYHRGIDGENPMLGRYSATRRVARTLCLGSAPTQDATKKGLEDRQIKLGCTQPGEASRKFAMRCGSWPIRRHTYIRGWQSLLVAAARAPRESRKRGASEG